MTTRIPRVTFLASLLAVACVVSGAAFSISPMNATVTPSPPGNLATFKVENDSAKPIAVVIRVATRSIDRDGNEKNEPVSGEFVVFPARVVIQSNSTQSVKVQWKGASSLPYEQAYRVIAEQVPVDFTRDQSSGVKVLFRYLASFYVAPPGIVARPVLESVTGMVQGGIPGLRILIRNDGTRHGLLFTPVLRLKAPGQSQTRELSGKQLESIEGTNILARTSRVFFIPWKDAVAGTVYESAFSASIE